MTATHVSLSVRKEIAICFDIIVLVSLNGISDSLSHVFGSIYNCEPCNKPFFEYIERSFGRACF